MIAPGIECAAVVDGLADAERDRHQIDDQRAPKAQRDGDRQALANQLHHRSAAKQAVAEVEAHIVPQHGEVAFVQRFVEAVPLGDLGDHLRIQAARTAILSVACRDARPGMAQAFADTAAAKTAAVPQLDGGDGLIHRATGRDLHDKKVDGDDRPQRGDHQ